MNLTLVASTCNGFYAGTLLAVECYIVYGHFSSVSGQKRTMVSKYGKNPRVRTWFFKNLLG